MVKITIDYGKNGKKTLEADSVVGAIAYTKDGEDNAAIVCSGARIKALVLLPALADTVGNLVNMIFDNEETMTGITADLFKSAIKEGCFDPHDKNITETLEIKNRVKDEDLDEKVKEVDKVLDMLSKIIKGMKGEDDDNEED